VLPRGWEATDVAAAVRTSALVVLVDAGLIAQGDNAPAAMIAIIPLRR
jgi:hypothetical protein